MEKKKNNAVEKAENVVKENKAQNSKSGKKSVSSSQKSAKTVDKKRLERLKKLEKKKKERAEKRQEIKEAKALKRKELEKVQAEKRVELARIKAHKKAEKQKAKAMAIRERNRRKAEYKKRKQELKAERDARREMLKKESKKDRQERIAKERKLKYEAVLEKRKHRLEKRQQILEAKKARREQKMRERQKNRERRKGFGGWLAAVISLGVATLVLASALTFTFLMPSAGDNLLETSYRKSFYDTVEMVDNIDLNLSKALATNDKSAMQRYLVDTAIDSELAENDLQQLPLHDESKHYTTKLINQIGDYSKYINNKIINGESLTKKDYEDLRQLYRANQTLKNSLQEMVGMVDNGYSFSSMLEDKSKNLVVDGFDELQNLSVQYPELIYDGPFSDGITNRETKGLKGAEIDEAYARERFSKIFSGYQISELESVGMTSSNIECYNVQAKVNDDVLYAQISKKGGELVMFSYAGSCNDVRYDADTATDKAEEFLSAIGHKNLKPVWLNLANNVYTINFAEVVDNVIIYSDLIKVRVCAETSMVIGLEASSYYTNHTDRVIEKPLLTKAQAAQKLSANMEVKSARLAVVPIGSTSEKLCYELSGIYDGSTYYVYIDALNGKQVEMFKVIESTEGTLLM